MAQLFLLSGKKIENTRIPDNSTLPSDKRLFRPDLRKISDV